MALTRRNFIRNAGMFSLAGIVAGKTGFAAGGMHQTRSVNQNGRMKLKFKPFDVRLKHTFTIASNSRDTTPVMFTEIDYEGYTGYGEAAMPPYLGESHKTANEFLSRVDLGQFSSPFLLEDILDYVDGIAPGNQAAKASVDIALHDLLGKIMEQPWYRIWGYNPEKTPSTSFTIGMDEPEVVRQKVKEAERFNVLKVKLGGGKDKEMIETVRSITDKPLYVDVNQGWKDKHMALDMAGWLKERGIEFIEQPMPTHRVDDIAWLTRESPLPVMADEGIQRLPDVRDAYQVYSGVNIKLDKCTGMREAHKMLNLAKSLDMKVLIGCMVASSCSLSAAAQLSPQVDWADLDGHLLINNDPFTGMKVKDGRVVLPEKPGIGVEKV